MLHPHDHALLQCSNQDEVTTTAQWSMPKHIRWGASRLVMPFYLIIPFQTPLSSQQQCSSIEFHPNNLL